MPFNKDIIAFSTNGAGTHVPQETLSLFSIWQNEAENGNNLLKVTQLRSDQNPSRTMKWQSVLKKKCCTLPISSCHWHQTFVFSGEIMKIIFNWHKWTSLLITYKLLSAIWGADAAWVAVHLWKGALKIRADASSTPEALKGDRMGISSLRTVSVTLQHWTTHRNTDSLEAEINAIMILLMFLIPVVWWVSRL